MSEIPPALLAAADQVYAGMLELLRDFEGERFDPGAFCDEFQQRLRMTVGPELYDRLSDPGDSDPRRRRQ